jgi:hypothetical protein
MMQLYAWDVNQLWNSHPKHPFSVHFFIAFESMHFWQKCRDTDRQAYLYPNTWGLPGLG